jgi:hypothetical protein
MYGSVKAFTPAIAHGLQALRARKSAFDKLGVSPLVLKDVQKLGAGAAKFSEAMITKDPVRSNPFTSLVKAWFTVSIGIYQASSD